jgi:hypothetical protein
MSRLLIKRQRIERVRVRCPMGESDKAFEYMRKGGFKIQSSGPKRMANYRVDLEVFEMVGAVLPRSVLDQMKKAIRG